MLMYFLWLLPAAMASSSAPSATTPKSHVAATTDYDSVPGVDTRWSTCRPSPGVSLYDFNATLIDGSYGNFTAYEGEVVVVTNVATYCGFTRQYLDFNKVLDNLAEKGLKILAFPCNQFNLEEPGANSEIVNGVTCVRPGHGYVPHKNMVFYEKLDVNGHAEHPLYTWLKSVCPPTETLIGSLDMFHFSPIKTTDVVWNFEKFLIDRTGQPRYRYHPGNWNFGKNVEPILTTLLAESVEELQKNP